MKSTRIRTVRSGMIGGFLLALLVLVSAGASAQGDLFELGLADLNLDGDRSRYVNFSEGFVFPLGGVRHAGCYVHGNGYVSFGGLGIPDPSPTITELVKREDEFSLGTGLMRIAAFWADLNPSTLGRGRVLAGPVGRTAFRVMWLDVPFRAAPTKMVTVILTLRSDGSFTIQLAHVPVPVGQIIVGFAAGHAQTNGGGSPTDLSTTSGTIGNGIEPAIFEYFLAETFDLDGRTLDFAPVLPTSGLLSLAGDDAIEVDLGFPFPFYGNRYSTVWVGSNGELNLMQWSPFAWVQTESGLLDDTARIVPFGADLNPTRQGHIRVSGTASSFTVSWVNVPETETSNSNTFSVTLRSDGTISCTYGRVDSPSKNSKVAIAVTGGWPVTTETEPPTAFVGNNTYGSGTEAALYRIYDGVNTGLSNQSLHFRPFTRRSPLPLVTNFARASCHRYALPDGFSFPFAGTRYREIFIGANGTVSFGSGDQGVNESPSELLTGFPRLAPCWNHYNPKSTSTNPQVEGKIEVTPLVDRVTISYSLPAWGAFNSPPLWNDFSVTLFKDGRFEYRYGRMESKDGLVGYAVGGSPASCLCDVVAEDLSAKQPLNHGAEIAVFEQFFGGEKSFDLANRQLAFQGAHEIWLRNAARLGAVLQMAIGAGHENAGRAYLMALALSSNLGITLPDQRVIPLDLDLLLVLSLLGLPLQQDFTGTLDLNGGSLWPALIIPDNTALLGLKLRAAFLALAASAPSGIAFISHSALLAVGPAKAAKTCTIAVTTQAQAAGWSVTVTVKDAAGLPRNGALIGLRLYGGPGLNPVAPMQFKNAGGAGTATFNINGGVGLKRVVVKGLVAPSHGCPLMRFRK